jgi:hypothetical protein
MAASVPRGPLLNSWKEIASYIGRSVRTVQRWERLGLPVRRLSPTSKSAVLAKSQDIDVWLNSARSHGFSIQQNDEHIFLRGSLAESLEISRTLRSQMIQLREERHQDLQKLVQNLQALVKSLGA